MNLEFAEMTGQDYEEVAALWQSVEGIGLHDDTDSREGVGSYLRRNPGLSFVARCEGRIAGAVLCGHDGRRGYLHHLAVDESCRRQGIGKALVERCLAALKAIGIPKCDIMVFGGNREALAFWKADGWIDRSGDLKFMQKLTDGRDDAGSRRKSC